MADPFENDSVLFSTALTAACKEWQIRLGLQDWIVKVDVDRLQNLGGSGKAFASNRYSLTKKYSRIRVVDPVDVPIIADALPDGEATDYDLHLVHELMHLHFAPFMAEENSAEELAQEQAINTISRSIVRAYRATGPAVSPTMPISSGHYI